MKIEDIEFEMIQDLLVSIVLTITAAEVSGGINQISVFLMDIMFAWGINLVIGLLVPEKKIGEKLIWLLKLEQSKISFFVMMLVIVVINVLGISACAVLKNVGFSTVFWKAWIGLLPILMVVGYIAAIIFFPVTNGIVKRINQNKNK